MTMYKVKTFPFIQIDIKTAMLKMLDQRTIEIQIIDIHIDGETDDKYQWLLVYLIGRGVIANLAQLIACNRIKRRFWRQNQRGGIKHPGTEMFQFFLLALKVLF